MLTCIDIAEKFYTQKIFQQAYIIKRNLIFFYNYWSMERVRIIIVKTIFR
jgi:hypothetical protein